MDKYLLVCEQLGEEPDPAKMPLDTSTFPAEVQVAFFIFGLLSDRWEGMSGSYLGKDWTNLEYIFKLHEIEPIERPVIFHIMKIYENIIVDYKFKEAEKKRKAEERRANSARGKTYTHNVRG